MSNTKLKQLFRAARQAAPPPLSDSLADEVLRAIRHPSPGEEVAAPSLFEELNARFFELAMIAALILVLGVAANVAVGTPEVTDWNDGVAQLSAQWFLLPEGL